MHAMGAMASRATGPLGALTPQYPAPETWRSWYPDWGAEHRRTPTSFQCCGYLFSYVSMSDLNHLLLNPPPHLLELCLVNWLHIPHYGCHFHRLLCVEENVLIRSHASLVLAICLRPQP